MKITYDPMADAMYIYLQGKRGKKVLRTQEIGDGIAVDYGPDQTVMGIEVLDASRRLKFRRGSLEVSLEQLGPKAVATR